MVGEEVERPLVVADRREEFVGAVDEVLRARRGVGGGDVVRADARIVAAAAVGADLEVRELRLQVRRSDAVELDVLRERCPEHRVAFVLGVVLRLVPDLPVGDLHLEAVGPALGVVPDHVLADSRPLRVVLGRQGVHGRVAARDEVLDRHAEAEERLHVVLRERLQEGVRVGEAVALRVVFVGVEVREDHRDVHEQAAAEPAAHVVEARVGDAGLLEVVEHRVVRQLADERRLADAVDGLHRPDGLAEVDLHVRRGDAERTRR